MIYRSPTLSDIPQLIQLGLISYGQYTPLMTEENKAKMNANISNEETWKNMLAIADGFVCEIGNQIVGMAFLVPSGNPWDIFPAEWSYIRMVGVDPEQTGMGIGKKLTEQCIEAAKNRKEKIVALHTSEVMHAARHIYEKAGFTVLKEVEKRLGLRYWMYVLSLE
jgi:ribosomal protein S18 acetylase RimI-like enzyme